MRYNVRHKYILPKIPETQNDINIKDRMHYHKGHK